jgi:hypothetical protein
MAEVDQKRPELRAPTPKNAIRCPPLLSPIGLISASSIDYIASATMGSV